MAYTTQTLLEQAFTAETILRLTDDSRGGVADAARIAEAIDSASEEINGYCRRHYAVPFATTPPIIEKLATDLAGFYLFRRRMGELGIPDSIELMHTQAIKQLEQIAKALLDLGVETPPPKSAAIVASSEGPRPLFTAHSMKDF